MIVIDMNGNVVKQWDGFVNSAGGPARVFPGGFVMAANGSNPPRQESLELVQRDFDGKILSRFDRNLQIQTRDGKTIWSARQHHDWQREDYPAGYYSPEANPSIQGGGNTLVLTHVNHDKPAIADAPLEDDRLSSRSRRRARSCGNGSRPRRGIRLLPGARSAIKAASLAWNQRNCAPSARSWDSITRISSRSAVRLDSATHAAGRARRRATADRQLPGAVSDRS